MLHVIENCGQIGSASFLADIPQIPGLLRVIFRPIEARRNEIRSHLTVLAAKSLDWPPRSVGTRRLAFIGSHLCRYRL
jgi:hypothetical protein